MKRSNVGSWSRLSDASGGTELMGRPVSLWTGLKGKPRPTEMSGHRMQEGEKATHVGLHSPPTSRMAQGTTLIRLPFGGTASSSVRGTPAAMVPTFWLLVALACLAVALFIWVRLELLAGVQV